ncbi:MAG TPA: MFS transporter [Acidimicrobiia bacterium]
MTLPLRVVQAVRPDASAGVLAGAAVVAAVFAATPFLLPDVSTRLGTPLGVTGLLSTAQVASFAAASFLAGRFLRPRRRLHYGSLILVAIACTASAVVPNFPLLLATRVLAGVGMGTLTWIAWADATRHSTGIGDVAAIAPVTAAVVSPILGWMTTQGGYKLVFVALSVIALVAIMFPVDFGDLPRVGRTVSGSRSNRILLAGLFLLTLGGSAVFVFSGAIGTEFVGLSAVTVAWALSLNAVAGVLGTRITARAGRAGVWLLGAAGSALIIGNVGAPVVYVVAITIWGFSYWVYVPAMIKLLAEKSLTPTERVGDAQASMAMGRVFGPIVGGVAVAGANFGRLSIVGSTIMLASAAIAIGVEWGRSRQNA